MLICKPTWRAPGKASRPPLECPASQGCFGSSSALIRSQSQVLLPNLPFLTCVYLSRNMNPSETPRSLRHLQDPPQVSSSLTLTYHLLPQTRTNNRQWDMQTGHGPNPGNFSANESLLRKSIWGSKFPRSGTSSLRKVCCLFSNTDLPKITVLSFLRCEFHSTTSFLFT